MKPSSFLAKQAARGVLLLLLAGVSHVRADTVETQSGERYVGKVLSLDTNQLVLQSETLGLVGLPRQKVAVITLGAAGTAARQPAPLAASPGVPPELAGLPQISGADSNVLQQLQAQLLGSGSAEAKQKFTELAAGYLSGRTSVNDIRAQARSAAEQLKQYKDELGPEAAGLLDGYLNILEKFVNDTAPAGAGARPGTVPSAKPKKATPQPGE